MRRRRRRHFGLRRRSRTCSTVSGQYAGPLGRLLAFGIDAGLMFALFTMGTAGLDYLLRVFFDTSIRGRGDTPWSLVAAIAWVFVYVVVTTTIAGRTPGKGIVGLRVVTAAGYTVTPGKVLLRTIMIPVAVIPLCLGLLPILLSRTRRGLQDAGRRYSGRLRLGRPSGQDAGPSVHIRGQSDRAGAAHPLGDASGSAGATFTTQPTVRGASRARSRTSDACGPPATWRRWRPA